MAYIIGGEISKSWVKKMDDIYICDGPTEFCLVHWDTINVTHINKDMKRFKNNICVNPITLGKMKDLYLSLLIQILLTYQEF